MIVEHVFVSTFTFQPSNLLTFGVAGARNGGLRAV
jgi:hypothetical protein